MENVVQHNSCNVRLFDIHVWFFYCLDCVIQLNTKGIAFIVYTIEILDI